MTVSLIPDIRRLRATMCRLTGGGMFAGILGFVKQHPTFAMIVVAAGGIVILGKYSLQNSIRGRLRVIGSNLLRTILARMGLVLRSRSTMARSGVPKTIYLLRTVRRLGRTSAIKLIYCTTIMIPIYKTSTGTTTSGGPTHYWWSLTTDKAALSSGDDSDLAIVVWGHVCRHGGSNSAATCPEEIGRGLTVYGV